MIKAAKKKLKFWSRKKKRKKTIATHEQQEHAHYPPPPSIHLPPQFHCQHCFNNWSPTEPSAPPMPPWLEPHPIHLADPQEQNIVMEISTTPLLLHQPLNVPEPSVSITPSSSSSSSYQQYMSPTSPGSVVHGLPLHVPTPLPRRNTSTLFGCLVGFCMNFISCFCPCLCIRGG